MIHHHLFVILLPFIYLVYYIFSVYIFSVYIFLYIQCLYSANKILTLQGQENKKNYNRCELRLYKNHELRPLSPALPLLEGMILKQRFETLNFKRRFKMVFLNNASQRCSLSFTSTGWPFSQMKVWNSQKFALIHAKIKDVFWGNRTEGMLNLSALTTRPFPANGLSFPLEKCPLVTPGGIEPGHSEF